MNASKLTVVALVGVLVAAGAVTAAATGMPGAGSDAEEEQGPRGVDVAATHDNGTVTVAVTTDGSGVENVTVLADDERVGTTDADGTVAFETNDSEELELELHKHGFEGELEYVLRNGSLLLLEEEYEYPEVEADDEDGDDDEADDEDDPDEDDETEDGDEEAEDEEDEEEETDEDADDEDEPDEDDEEQESDD